MNAQITKPMLASKCERPDLLPFPVLATPKLDGIRCLKVGGRALTRSFKPISNRFAREWIEANLPDGVDGELMLRGGTFSETTSAIGRRAGEPDFVFHVFDYVAGGIEEPYAKRMRDLAALPDSPQVVKVLPVEIRNAAELAAYEERCLAEGYEGVMVRTPDSPYKCGRSTEREAWLLKIKRFEDAEAVVLATYEGHDQPERRRAGCLRAHEAQSRPGWHGRPGRTRRLRGPARRDRRGVPLGLQPRGRRRGPGDPVAPPRVAGRQGGEVQPPAERCQGCAPVPEVPRVPRGVGHECLNALRSIRAPSCRTCAGWRFLLVRDGARQTTRAAGRKEDVGMHNPPA